MVPTVIPSYIRAITSPFQSPQPVHARTLANYDHPMVGRNTPTPSPARLSPFYEEGQTTGAIFKSLIDFTADFEDFGTSQAFLEEPVNVLMTGFEVPNILSPKTLGLGCGDNSLRPGHSRHNFSAPLEQLRQHDGAQVVPPTRERSTSCTGTDWRTFFTLSPATTFTDCPSNLDLGLLQDTRECLSSQYCSNTSPKLGIATVNDNPLHLDRSHSCLVTSASTYQDNFSVITFSGTDPEAIITPVQLLKSQLSTLIQDHRSIQRNWHYVYKCLMLRLLQKIGSEWLLDGIKKLLLSTYEAAASSARHNIAAESPITDESLILSSEEHRNDQANRQSSSLQAKFTTYCDEYGTLKIGLGTISKSTDIHGQQSLSSVNVSFFPDAKIRTTGVSVTFVRMPEITTSKPIPWHITTVNVVPENAEIIRCVQQGNLHAVRRLFQKGEASARDVDPRGFSLLSVGKLSLKAQGYKLRVI